MVRGDGSHCHVTYPINEFLSGFSDGLKLTFFALNAIPTFYRRGSRYLRGGSPWYEKGQRVGASVGLSVDVMEGVFAFFDPRVIAVPAATNMASGIYETASLALERLRPQRA